MTAQRFCPGTYVVNARLPDWGTGKVLDNLGAGKVRVFFEYVGEKVMREEALSLAAAPEDNPLLENVDSTRTLTGFKPFLDLQDSFLNKFKLGFQDPKYLEWERDYKVNASTFLREQMPEEALAELMAQEKYEAVCTLAQKVLNKTNLVFPNEKMALRDGLRRGVAEQRLFAEALHQLLYGTGEMGDRFDAFAATLEELDACKWPIATYFLFLADPGSQIFVKPSYVQAAARSYAFEISYETRPNWACYRRIMALVAHVTAQLAKRERLKPRDLIDVQGFIWCSLVEEKRP